MGMLQVIISFIIITEVVAYQRFTDFNLGKWNGVNKGRGFPFFPQ